MLIPNGDRTERAGPATCALSAVTVECRLSVCRLNPGNVCLTLGPATCWTTGGSSRKENFYAASTATALCMYGFSRRSPLDASRGLLLAVAALLASAHGYRRARSASVAA